MEIINRPRYKTAISINGIPLQNKTSYWLQWVSSDLNSDGKHFVYKYREFKYNSPQDSWYSIAGNIYSYIHNHIESDRCFFEVVPHTWNRFLCFDIDVHNPCNSNDLSIVELLIPAIMKWLNIHNGVDKFDESLVWVWSSCRPDKLSYHLTLTDFYLPSNLHAKQAYYEILTYIPIEYHPFIDHAVYGSLQSWRLAHCIKRNIPYKYHKRLIRPDSSSIPSDPPHLDFIKSFSAMVDTDIHRSSNLILEAEIRSATLKHKLPTFTRNLTIPNDIPHSAQPAISLLNKYNSDNNISPPGIPIFIYASYSSNLINLQRVRAALCPLCLRIHEHDNAFLLITGINQSVYFYCRRSPKLPNKRSSFVNLGSLNLSGGGPPLFLPPCIDESYESTYVKSIKEHLLVHRSLIIKSPLGTGKTTAIIDFIKEYKPSSVLHIGVRQLYDHNIFGEYIINNLPFVHYQDPDLPYYLGNIPYLVIQLESIIRLIHSKRYSISPKELVVLDEIETLLAQLTSLGTIKNIRKTLYAFYTIINMATYVIATDAFLSELSQTILTSLRPSIFTIDNTYKPPQQTAIRLDSFNSLLSEFVSHLSNNHKCAFFSSSKQKVARILTAIAPLNKKILVYTSDTPIEDRKALRDVRNSWKNVDAVIFSPVLTVGVSYDLRDFHTNFAYFAPNTCRIRDMFQSIHRIRSFSSKNLYFCIGKSPPNISKYKNNITAKGTVPQIKKRINNYRQENVLNHLNNRINNTNIDLSEAYVDQTTNVDTNIERFIADENIPQFYLDIQAYSIAEYNNTLYRSEESIYMFFRFCNYIVADSRTTFYPKLKLSPISDNSTPFNKIPILNKKYCLSIIKTPETWNELVTGLRSYIQITDSIKCFISILLNRQYYGIITPLQKSILSKYFLTVLFKPSTPSNILEEVWNKYWTPTVGNHGQKQLKILVHFVRTGTPYCPNLDTESNYISMNGPYTRLQLHADKIFKYMNITKTDLINGRTFNIDELKSVFDYLSIPEVETELRNILGVYEQTYSKRINNAYGIFVNRVNSLKPIYSIDLKYHIELFEHIQRHPGISNLIKVLFSVGHITRRRENSKTKLDPIEEIRIKYKQLYSNTHGGMKSITNEIINEFRELMSNNNYVNSINIILVLRNTEHDENIIKFKLLYTLLEVLFNIVLSNTTQQIGHMHHVILSNIVIPHIPFIKHIKM